MRRGGNLAHYNVSCVETAVPVVLKNDEITFEQLRALLYEERAFHNVVISPGPGSPTRAEDIGMHHFYSFCELVSCFDKRKESL